jgi:tryptophan synthase alpha chain
MSERYRVMFDRLASAGDGAFVPFAMLGDPDPGLSLEVLHALIAGGADALELGMAFSDPLADGPTIQAASGRALAAGIRPERAWSLVSEIRRRHPALPIGLLAYANLLEAPGLDAFYGRAAAAGLDSVLVADVPTHEAPVYVRAARRHGILPVLIAAPNGAEAHLREVARLSAGFTYVVTRPGVTGAEDPAQTGHAELLRTLRELGSPPPLLGFGISRPEQVRAALDSGAAGAISGSAVVRIIERLLGRPEALLEELRRFVAEMKRATRREEVHGDPT